MKLTPLAISILLVFVGMTNAYKVLLLMPFPGPSHWHMFKIFIRELVDRGHEVTAITAFPYKENIQNYTEILIDPPYKFETIGFSTEMNYEADNQFNEIYNIYFYYLMGVETTRHAFENENVRTFMKTNKEQFDLIISEQFFQEAFLMFSKIFNAPIVSIATFGYWDHMDRLMGFVPPLSFVPHTFLMHWGDNMNYFQRCYNTILSLADYAMRNYYYLPGQNKLALEFFSEHIKGTLPTIYELENSISVILVNTHTVISKPRPLMPGLINIAGAHIKPVKKLPADLQTILDGNANGVIYFCLGSYMQSSRMPKDKMKIILNTLSKLKQTVLWKFESDDIPELPKNVFVQKWMPQNDILSHPNVIAFISQGGMFAITEAMYYSRPMLIIPFFGDQLRNAEFISNNGIGKILRFKDITEDTLNTNINEILNNQTYTANARRFSNILRDNPLKPMEESMFWMDYVVRHKGAPHLKSSAVHLSWGAYMLWDVFAGFLLIIFVIFYLIRVTVKTVFAKNKNDRKRHEKAN